MQPPLVAHYMDVQEIEETIESVIGQEKVNQIILPPKSKNLGYSSR